MHEYDNEAIQSLQGHLAACQKLNAELLEALEAAQDEIEAVKKVSVIAAEQIGWQVCEKIRFAIAAAKQKEDEMDTNVYAEACNSIIDNPTPENARDQAAFIQVGVVDMLGAMERISRLAKALTKATDISSLRFQLNVIADEADSAIAKARGQS